MRTAVAALSAIVVLSAIVAFSAHSATGGIRPLADAFTDKRFWETVKWETIETSAFGKDPKWSVEDGRNGDGRERARYESTLIGETRCQ